MTSAIRVWVEQRGHPFRAQPITTEWHVMPPVTASRSRLDRNKSAVTFLAPIWPVSHGFVQIPRFHP
jgi:hypothetical protein